MNDALFMLALFVFVTIGYLCNSWASMLNGE